MPEAPPGGRTLVIGHLYPGLMNLYGDRGNIVVLVQRARWRGIQAEVRAIELGQRIDPGDIDILFIGGGQDQEQRAAADDLASVKKPGLQDFLDDGGVALAVCGGYQLFGHHYVAGEGDILPGVGVFDAWTEHPGPQDPRCIGNVVADANPVLFGDLTLVGFENHGGRTFLAPGATALATVRTGYGNNGKDGTEGCVDRNAFGTYLHGSLLPKNPRLADHLLGLALRRRYGDIPFPPLDDTLERAAHQAILNRTAR